MFKDVAFKVVIEVGFKLAILLMGLLYCSTTYYHSRYVPVIQNNTNNVICFDTHTGKSWVADFVVDKADRPYWPAMWSSFITLQGRADMKLSWTVQVGRCSGYFHWYSTFHWHWIFLALIVFEWRNSSEQQQHVSELLEPVLWKRFVAIWALQWIWSGLHSHAIFILVEEQRIPVFSPAIVPAWHNAMFSALLLSIGYRHDSPL